MGPRGFQARKKAAVNQSVAALEKYPNDWKRSIESLVVSTSANMRNAWRGRIIRRQIGVGLERYAVVPIQHVVAGDFRGTRDIRPIEILRDCTVDPMVKAPKGSDSASG